MREITHALLSDTSSAEVFDLRERYSAKRYVAHMKAAMAGDHKGRGEWARHIHSLSPDDYNAFFWDVDRLVEAGELVHVLSPEEVAQVQQRVLDNIEHWRVESSRLAKDYGIDPAAMHRALNGGAEVTEEDLLAIDEDEVDVWAEDEDEHE
jgi:hypothetical protein